MPFVTAIAGGEIQLSVQRPGGKSESVSVKDGRSCHWSSDDPLNDGRGKGGCGCHDAFDLYACFEHGGDVGRAVKAAAELLGMTQPHGRQRKTGVVSTVNTSTPAEIDPYKPFPLDALPQTAALFVSEAAKALGCEASYVAAPLLAALASAIGNSRRIRLKQSWVEPPVLWAAVVGDSGTLKSPSHDAALRPLRRRQKRAMKEFKQAQAEYHNAREQYDDQIKAWRKAKPEERGERPEEPQAPACERLLCSDTTVEALADRLSNAPRGLLVARAVAALGIDPAATHSYGKAAIVGEAGEREHAAAILHPRMGRPIREVIGPARAIIPSAKKIGGPGTSIDCPLHYKDDAWRFSHFDAIEASVSDAPRADEIVVVFALTDAGRPLHRVGEGIKPADVMPASN